MANIEIIIETTDRASNPLRQINIQLGDLENASDVARVGLSGLQQLLAASLKVAIAGVTAALSGLGAAIISSVGTAADLEKQMSAIGAVTGATSEELAQLKELTQALGTDDRFSVTTLEAASALEMLGKNGVSTADILGVMGEATVLLNNSTMDASRGIEGFATAGDILTDTLSVFGEKTENAINVVDLITAVTSNSKFDIDAFAGALANGGLAADTAGVSLEDFAATVVGISSGFKSGEEAGTALKTLFTGFVPATDATAEAFKRLGLMTEDGTNLFYDANGALKDMDQIAGLLRSSLSGLSEKMRTELLVSAFGKEGMNAAIGLMKLGKDGINELKATMADTSAVDVAATRMDNFRGSLSILGGVIETIQIGIGDKFLPVVTSAAQGLTSTLKENADRIITFFGEIAAQIDIFLVNLENGFAAFKAAWAGDWIEGQFVLPFQEGIASVTTSALQLYDSILPFVEWQDVLAAIGVVIASVVIPALASLITAIAPVAAVAIGLVTTMSVVRQNWGQEWAAMEGGTAQALGRIAGFMSAFASQAAQWGVGIVNALAEGIRLAVSAVIQAVQYLGSILGLWMTPHSPPKFLPDIRLWGEGTVRAWLDGFKNADLAGGLRDFAGRVDDELASATSQLSAVQANITFPRDFEGQGSNERLNNLRALQGQEGLSDERSQQIAVQIQEIQLQQRIGRLAKERFELHKQLEQTNKKLDFKPQVEALKSVAGALKGVAGALVQSLSPQEERLRGIRLQQSELESLIRLHELQAILEDESISAADKKLALLEMQTIEAEQAIRGEKAKELGVDLSALRQIAIHDEERIDAYQQQVEAIQLQQAELRDLIRLREIEDTLTDASISGAERKLALLEKERIEAEKGQRASRAEELGVDLSGLSGLSTEGAEEQEKIDAYKQQVEALNLQQAELRDLIRLREIEATLADSSISDAEKKLALLEREKIIAAQGQRTTRAGELGVDLSGLSGLSTQGAETAAAIDPLKQQLEATRLQQAEMQSLIRLKELQAIIDDENSTEAEKQVALLQMQAIETERAIRAQKATELGIDLSALQAVPITFKEIGTAGTEALKGVAEGAAKGAGGLKGVAEGALESISSLDEMKGSVKDLGEEMLALPPIELPPIELPPIESTWELPEMFPVPPEMPDFGFGDMKAQLEEFRQSFSLGFGEGEQAFADLALSIQPVTDALDSMRESLSPITDFINKIVENGDVVGIIAGIATGFATFKGLSFIVPILSTIGTALSAISAVLIGGGGLTGLVLRFSLAWGALSTAVGGISGVIGSIVALLGGPVTVAIGAVALAVGTLTAAWINNWGDIQGKTATFVEWMGVQWEGFKTGVKGFVDAVIGFFQYLYDTLVGNSIVPDLVNDIISFFTDLYNEAPELISDMVDNVSEFFQDLYDKTTEIASDLWTDLKAGMTDWIAQMGLDLEGVGTLFSDMWDRVKTTFDNFITMITVTVPNHLKTLKKNFKDTWDKIAENISNAIGGIIDNIKEYLNKIIDLMNNAISSFNALPGPDIGTIPRLAAGGPVVASQAYIVGDGAGPELFVPSQPGRVYPAGQTRGMTTASAGHNFDITIHVHGASSDDIVERLRNELGSSLTFAARSAGLV